MRRRGSKNTQNRSKIRQLGVLMGFVSLLTLLIGGFFSLKHSHHFPLRQVIITPTLKHLDAALLKNVLQEHLRGDFFSLNVPELKKALLAQPWVYDVSFRRLWPDRLEVHILEQEAVAQLATGEVINVQGDLFMPSKSSLTEKLPVLLVPLEQLKASLQLLQRFEKKLAPFGIQITSFRLNERDALQLEIGDHTLVLLGREDRTNRFERFISVYPKLIGSHLEEIQSVDLRYPNGLAIKRKDQPNHEKNAISR